MLSAVVDEGVGEQVVAAGLLPSSCSLALEQLILEVARARAASQKHTLFFFFPADVGVEDEELCLRGGQVARARASLEPESVWARDAVRFFTLSLSLSAAFEFLWCARDAAARATECVFFFFLCLLREDCPVDLSYCDDCWSVTDACSESLRMAITL